MRRAAAWACVVAAVAAVAAAGVSPWPAPVGAAADSLNAAFDSSELRWTLPQAATFHALPWPSLVLMDARLKTASGAEILNAPEARLDLSFRGLIKGEFRPIRAFLTTPVLTLDLDSPFVSPWDMPGAVAKLKESVAPLDELRFENGVLRLSSRALGVDTEINALNGRLLGLSAGRELRVDLAGVWRDAPVKIVGSLNLPGQATKGEASALNLAVSGPPGTAAFSGALAGGENAGFAGDFTSSVSSVAALRRLLGLSASHTLAADDVTIGGKLKATPDQATLSEATVSSAGQTLQGALEVAKGGARPILSGTLDAQQLAIAPIVGTLAPLVELCRPLERKAVRL